MSAARARDHRAGRAAEALGERDRHEVERGGQRCGVVAAGGGRVEQPGAVEVGGGAELAGGGGDAGELLAVPHQPAHAVVGVLDLDQRGRRVEHVPARLHRGAQLLGREEPVGANFGELDAGVGGRGAGLVPHGVALDPDHHVVAGRAVELQRQLVGHRARGHEQRGFLAEQRRHALLQEVDARVLAELVVADLGLRHRAAHGRRGAGDRI